MDDIDIDLISFLKSSKFRYDILKLMEKNILTPSEISKNANIRFSYVSKLLNELVDKKLVVCMNTESKRARLYKITDLGKNILTQYLDMNKT